jgi:DNA (cytosine-5)-methyltransferase 1
LDVFSGCGGLSLGFRSAGFKVVGAIESETLAAFTYGVNFPNVELFGPTDDEPTGGDVTKLSSEAIASNLRIQKRELGLLIGGPPCQGFSQIGHRKPDDPRNNLYRHFVRLIADFQPRAFVFENVPGMEDQNDGREFADLIARLKKLGYSASKSLVNAATYGVPQMRTRVFVVGARGAADVSFGAGSRTPARYTSVEQAFQGLPPRPPAISGTILDYASGAIGSYAALMSRESDVLTNCSATRHNREIVARFRKLACGTGDPTTKHRRLDPEQPSWTLRAGSRTRTACRPVHPDQPRVITVREAARLTSFPDEFWLPPQTAGAHMLLGNSVPPLLAHYLAEAIGRQLFLDG